MAEPKVPDEPFPEETPGDPLEDAMRLAFGPAPTAPWSGRDSVLEALREKTGGIPRVLLRDLEEEGSLVEKPLSSRTSESPGSVGRYQVFGEIGRGGVGSVLKGRDTDLNRDVALKVLLGPHGGNPEMVQRFVEEAQIGGQLQHPGIVPVYDLGLLSGERPYFAMKLVKGRTLAAHLEARKDPTQDRRRFLGIFEQVCQTVAYAHARGVIHRDLKPSNVMVGAFGEVLVMDWGLAKVLSVGEEDRPRKSQAAKTVISTVRSETPGSESQAGLAMGTPAYMSPEQARGDVDELDERSDVFGLGAILCEILTGKPPYLGQTAEGIRKKAARGNLEEALARLDACGAEDELLGIAKRCLAPEARERPRDAGVVAREVGAYLASVEERARASELAAAEARVKAEEEKRARKLTLALAASVLVALVLGGGGYLWVEKDRRARALETARAVGGALEEATLLWGQAKAAPVGDLSKWAEALSAGKRAEALALTGRADVATLERVRGFLRGLGEEETKARQAAEQAEVDRRMVEKLDEIRTQHGDVFDWRTHEPEYAQIFRDYGIDIDALEPEEAAKRIRESAISSELSAALDHWASLRKGSRGRKDEAWKRLTQISRAADPDPWRTRLREAREAGDLEKLRSLAASPEVMTSSPWTLDLLAGALDSAGDREGAETLYQTAHRLHPGDFWINHNLGILLGGVKPPQWGERIRFLTAALALRPQSSHVWADLGFSLRAKGDLDGAVAAYREAIRLKPDLAEAHNSLGIALKRKGDLDAAMAAYREAIRLKPDNAHAHNNLGIALHTKRDLEGAIAAWREAIGLKPDFAQAHTNLGIVLKDKGDLDGAMAACREAIRLKPGYADAHGALGDALKAKHDLDGAIAAYLEAIRLKPGYADAHGALGDALKAKGDLDGAIVAYREAIRLRPGYAMTHYNLGNTVRDKGDLDGAMAAYREAIRLEPGHAGAHCNLGDALQRKGLFSEALAAFRRGHELGSKRPDWRYPSETWVRRCERFVELEPRLAAIQRGEARPADAREMTELADLCYHKRLYSASASFSKSAFEEDPKLAENLGAHRYNAACAAALAGYGQGSDAAALDSAARAGWRSQALEWLRAELSLLKKKLGTGKAEDLEAVRRNLEHWKRDPDLAGLRDQPRPADLPEAEREACRSLWACVDALLKQATGSENPMKAKRTP